MALRRSITLLARRLQTPPPPPSLSLSIQRPLIPIFSFSTFRTPDSYFQSQPHRIARPENDSALTHLLNRLSSTALPSDPDEAMAYLDDSGITPTKELVTSLIWALREEWRAAFLGFKWGHKRGCFDGDGEDDDKVWSLMVWVLGNHHKFSSAWCLIKDMFRSEVDTRMAMLTMIDRYTAVDNPSKAIWTFESMEKFRMAPDEEAFCTLLNTLCRSGYIEEAEEYMLSNKKLFPLEAESFNIILNGWCNISVDIYEAKRVWRQMSQYCIEPNATSYTHLISCHSKVGNLFDSLRLYDEMKKRGWVPCLDVYNSIIYVLTSENCLSEALKMLEKLKARGLNPSHVTYNNMIRPLCDAGKPEEARGVLSAMLDDDIHPTIDTYHAFLEVTGYEETLEVFSRMGKTGLGPTADTFLIVLRKFLRVKQTENALKIWIEMRQYDMMPTAAHYTLLVHELGTFGYVKKAKEIYLEMISRGFRDDPKLKKIFKKPVEGSRNKNDELHPGEIQRERRVNLRKFTMVRSKIKRQHCRSSNEKKKTTIEGS